MKLAKGAANKGWSGSRAFLRALAITGLTLTAAANYGVVRSVAAAQDTAKEPVAAAKTPPALGTIRSISGNTLVLTSDAGAEVHVDVRDSTKIVRIAPGQKDLKDAQTMALTDLQVGDRILVRGKPGDDGKTFAAASIVAMKKADIADKQSHERDEWQKSGVAGLVNSVDAPSQAISVTVPSLREKKTVIVRISAQTALRRYAPGSVKFDDAKAAPLEQIRTGDQVRARGEKNADGSELTATEVVSGSFRNISGIISSLDSGQGTITVHDLATKKTVIVKITSESQLRKLPAPMAQRIAQRLNAGSGAPGGDQAADNAAGGARPAPTAKDSVTPTGGQSPGMQAGAGEANGQGRTRGDGSGNGRGFGSTGSGGAGGGTMDLQQMILRMPASTISDLAKGDAVMLVGTEESTNGITAIILLAGVEPILQGSPNGASSILSPWSLSGAPGGEAGSQ